MQKLKNKEPRPKFTDSYKEKSVSKRINLAVGFPIFWKILE